MSRAVRFARRPSVADARQPFVRSFPAARQSAIPCGAAPRTRTPAEPALARLDARPRKWAAFPSGSPPAVGRAAAAAAAATWARSRRNDDDDGYYYFYYYYYYYDLYDYHYYYYYS